MTHLLQHLAAETERLRTLAARAGRASRRSSDAIAGRARRGDWIKCWRRSTIPSARRAGKLGAERRALAGRHLARTSRRRSSR